MLYFVSIYEGGPRPVLLPHGAKVGTPGSVLILQHNAMKLIMMEDVGLNDVTFTVSRNKECFTSHYKVKQI